MSLIQAYLQPLHCDDNPAMPSKQDELEASYYLYHDRGQIHLVVEEDVIQDFWHWKRHYEGGNKKK